MALRPEVFVSATSRDLGTCREAVKQALLTLGCLPVEQTTFPPDGRSVREMLSRRIAGCQAVVHIAGEVYGAEPQDRALDEPRRSYTQLEHDIARDLGKAVYVFLCGPGFPYDAHEPEDETRRALQQEHRARLEVGDHLHEVVSSREQLFVRVHALQTRVEQLTRDLQRSRRWLVRGLVVGLGLAGLAAVGLWALESRTSGVESKVASLTTELERQRTYIRSVAEAYSIQASQVADLKLSDEQILERAIAWVAEQERIPAAEIRAGMALFAAAVKADPGAGAMDRALAAFAERRFAAAAEGAGHAADEARTRRLAAERLAERATAEASAARVEEREARSLEGQALSAAGQHVPAAEALQAALDLTSRGSDPEGWAALQASLGAAENAAASVVVGAEIAVRRARAIAALRAALEVLTRQAGPLDWAWTQHHLAVALRDLAIRGESSDRARLLEEAASASRAALEVHDQAAFPQQWVGTQTVLAAVLGAQAGLTLGPDRKRLLTEAESTLRAILGVATRETWPDEWAVTQQNLAAILRDQALTAVGPERARLMAEVVASFRAVVQAIPREVRPQDWANVQVNLGIALRDQAVDVPADERTRLLGESVAAHRAALEVFTRENAAQAWALAQRNLAATLMRQALGAEGPERVRRLAEAHAASRAALEVFTREAMPQDWASAQYGLANTLLQQALVAPVLEGAALVEEALRVMRSTLEVVTATASPDLHAGILQWIAQVEALQAQAR